MFIMKKMIIFVFVIFSSFVNSAESSSIVEVKRKDTNIEWMRPHLSDSLINSEYIFICTTKTLSINSNDYNEKLVELTSLIPIFESGGENTYSSTGSKKVMLVNNNFSDIHRSQRPLLLSDVKYILFLKKTVLNDDTRKRYAIEKNVDSFDFCVEDPSAAIIIEVPPRYVKKINVKQDINKNYNMDNQEKLIDAIKKLVIWRDVKRPKEERVKGLLDLMNSTRQEPIYQENIPKILAHLGVKIIEKDKQFVIQDQTDKSK